MLKRDEWEADEEADTRKPKPEEERAVVRRVVQELAPHHAGTDEDASEEDRRDGPTQAVSDGGRRMVRQGRGWESRVTDGRSTAKG